MIDTNSAVMEAATELGFTSESTEAIPSVETESTSTDAKAKVETKEGEAPTQEGEESQEAVEGEGEESAIPEKTEEAPKTAQELEAIEARSKEIELKEKAFMDRMQAQEKEFQQKYHEKLKSHDEVDTWLSNVAESDPELFEVIKASFQDHQKQFNNPLIASLREEQAKIKEELDGFKAKASDEVTRTKLDAEMNQIRSTLGKEAETAGLKVDWTKVEDVWADNPKLSIKDAFFALHGESMMKAMASKAKVEAVAKKVQGRPTVTTAGNVKSANASITKDIPTDAFGAVQHYARQLAGYRG